MRYPDSIEKLINLLKKLPGVGRRTAERYAFDFVLHWSHQEVADFAKHLQDIQKMIKRCPECGGISGSECTLCCDLERSKEVLCVVSSPKDIFAIEGTSEFMGLYHVLPGLLSPLDGRGVEFLQLQKLQKRIVKNGVREIILAIDSSLEGDATCLLIKQELENMQLKVSRLAFGIPVGSSLEYVDGGTLARAFHGRSVV